MNILEINNKFKMQLIFYYFDILSTPKANNNFAVIYNISN